MNESVTNLDDLRLFGDAARAFAATVRTPTIDVCARAADLGFTSLFAPKDVGGLDADVEALCAILRPIACEDAGVAAALLVHAGAQWRMRAAGPWPESLGATDLLARPLATSSTAPSLRAGHLHGHVALVPLAASARRIVLVAPGEVGPTIASCPGSAPGLSLAPVEVLGLQRCAPCDASFTDVESEMHGPLEPDAADELRAGDALGVAAIALGILEGALVTATDYAEQRRQGGRRIVEWPEVERMLSSVRDSLVVLGAALEGVKAARRDGDTAWREAASALARRATDAARTGTSDGVQILGGNGYMKDYPQERRMRDARQLRCMSVT